MSCPGEKRHWVGHFPRCLSLFDAVFMLVHRKTTTMLFKMIAVEMAHEASGQSCRQIFVTKSPALARMVQEYYHRIRRRPQVDKSSEVFYLEDIDYDLDPTRALPKSFSLLEDSHFPLFLTSDEVCPGDLQRKG